MKLYEVLIGATPKGRHTEQHDVFFGVGNSLKDLLLQMKAFWPEAADCMHVDAFREITKVGNHRISIVKKNEAVDKSMKLYFINLGGYKKDEFDEFHYKMVIAAASIAEAIQQAKQTTFYKHTGFDKANSHVDDKYGVDIDDVYEVNEILDAESKMKYAISITEADDDQKEDAIHLGYFKLSKIEEGIFESE